MTKLLDADWLRSVQLLHSTKAPNFSLNREYGVDNENCPPEELDKALQKFYVEVCNFVMPIINFWQNFQTSLELLIPNCTHNRMITYTYRL